ncbi:hypothetical protein AAG570_006769 [Ranatra chinensis]|uniref:Uncharacterized protein n=1 Tax=Ranatra chinensis TaxID=642074 RepID=A0ABD0Z7Q8_9HEMI
MIPVSSRHHCNFEKEGSPDVHCVQCMGTDVGIPKAVCPLGSSGGVLTGCPPIIRLKRKRRAFADADRADGSNYDREEGWDPDRERTVRRRKCWLSRWCERSDLDEYPPVERPADREDDRLLEQHFQGLLNTPCSSLLEVRRPPKPRTGRRCCDCGGFRTRPRHDEGRRQVPEGGCRCGGCAWRPRGRHGKERERRRPPGESNLEANLSCEENEPRKNAGPEMSKQKSSQKDPGQIKGPPREEENVTPPSGYSETRGMRDDRNRDRVVFIGSESEGWKKEGRRVPKDVGTETGTSLEGRQGECRCPPSASPRPSPRKTQSRPQASASRGTRSAPDPRCQRRNVSVPSRNRVAQSSGPPSEDLRSLALRLAELIEEYCDKKLGKGLRHTPNAPRRDWGSIDPTQQSPFWKSKFDKPQDK